METQDMVKGIAGVSNEGISAGVNTTDCAVALAGICAQAADLSTDGDTSDDGAECLVPYENVERTRAGGHFSYDVNWVLGRLQPGTVGGTLLKRGLRRGSRKSITEAVPASPRQRTPQAEEEEEHDRSTPEKSDGAEDEEGGNEGDDSGPSRGQSQDTDDDDNSDDKSASQSAGEDRSATSEGDDSPSPSRTLRGEGKRQARNGSDTEEPVGDRQIVQHVSATGKGLGSLKPRHAACPVIMHPSSNQLGSSDFIHNEIWFSATVTY
ncbi:hypothetical protein CBR_g40060 [Chara braunii]|uniref:Uncharacterized protein n=1 Tax=Chara braunii TaxID=69332 RepID=A0A388LSW5_CHABU|nr:hypothetical protein CBR_g40060 [Chara braunii]|eukprot:GBG85418.1 hypothetical protein CBR_g40060 [Chara braunii]